MHVCIVHFRPAWFRYVDTKDGFQFASALNSSFGHGGGLLVSKSLKPTEFFELLAEMDLQMRQPGHEPVRHLRYVGHQQDGFTALAPGIILDKEYKLVCVLWVWKLHF